jgi:potassium-transporting ATPase KdpC subunit
MRSQFRPAIVSLVLLTVITGVIYPAIVTAVAKVAFAGKASGSIMMVSGKPVGSDLIGQPFSEPKYFWSRPSATSPVPYAADSGSGSNLGPTNPALVDAVKQRIAALRAADPQNQQTIPVDLVTASASGLDPHISVAAAEYQVSRVARARGTSTEKVEQLISQCKEEPTLGVMGDARVNVLKLNLALDGN